jgi:hypothetical protein
VKNLHRKLSGAAKPVPKVAFFAELLHQTVHQQQQIFPRRPKSITAVAAKQRVSRGSSGKNYSENKILNNFRKK